MFARIEVGEARAAQLADAGKGRQLQACSAHVEQ
jgi:hypothetical protein